MNRTPCKYFLDGSCRNGSRCDYSHSPVASPAQSPKICRYFADGNCDRGNSCKYLHSQLAVNQFSKPASDLRATSIPSPFQPQLTNTVKYCYYFARGHCDKGSTCEFEHSQSQPVAKNEKKEICTYFLIGKCKYGTFCDLSHSNPVVETNSKLTIKGFQVQVPVMQSALKNFLKSEEAREPIGGFDRMTIYNCYEKRPIDWLRNATDVSIPMLQLIVRFLHTTFQSAMVGWIYGTWAQFAERPMFNDLNVLLKLIKKNCNPGWKVNLSRLFDNEKEADLFECTKLMRNPQKAKQLATEIYNGKEASVITMAFFLIEACRNVFAHQGYKGNLFVTYGKYVYIAMAILHEFVAFFGPLVKCSCYGIFLGSLQSVIDLFLAWKSAKNQRIHGETSVEEAKKALKMLYAAVCREEPEAISFSVHAIGSRLNERKD